MPLLDFEKAGDEARQAFYNLFIGRGSGDEAATVLDQLAIFTGYYGARTPDTSDEELRYMEGRRSVFALILRLSGADARKVTE